MSKKILISVYTLFVSLVCMCQTANENYTLKEIHVDAQNTIKSVQYYNGLGYPTVSVANVGGNGETAYSLTTYDDLWREKCIYLPVADKNKSLLYKTPDEVITMHSDKTAYSQNHYDGLNRITSVELPGEEWKKNNKRKIKDKLSRMNFINV